MKRIVLGIAVAAGFAITLGQVPAAGQLGVQTRPSPFDGPLPSPTQKIMSFFLTVPFTLGEVDLSTLGVSSAELATVGPQASAAPGGDMLIVDDGTDCPNFDYTSIQDAVTAATPGTKIKVCRGVYVEQVVIPSSKDDITLFSEGALQAIIKAPPFMVADNAIVQISGATGVTLRHFTITGPGGTGCNLHYGVRVDSGGSALITDNHITEIHDTPFSGCQNGIGVLVGRASESTAGSAIVVHNLIDKYQKGGIVIDGPPDSGGGGGPDDFTSSATTVPGASEVAFNIVVGIGSTSLIAQNGIQISRGAVAERPPQQGLAETTTSRRSCRRIGSARESSCTRLAPTQSSTTISRSGTTMASGSTRPSTQRSGTTMLSRTISTASTRASTPRTI